MTSAIRPSVLVIGEALIDIIVRGDHEFEHVGGSPANVAAGIGRQDVDVTLLTRLGRDARGLHIATQIEASGATVANASWTDTETSTARARLRADGSAEYEFHIDWTLDAEAASKLVDAAPVVHAGSIAMFVQPGGEATLAALERARDAGKIVTVDPNIRPALVGDDARAVAERAFGAASIVKLSDEDAETLYPGQAPHSVLETIAALGVPVASVTMGSEGALALAAGDLVEQAPLRVEVADTIGAGDAFMASLIVSAVEYPTLLTGDREALERSLRRAAVTAGLTVSRLGANPPSRAEIDELI